ncbi:MAG: hypothetical protein PHX18_01760 [Candidatus Gastranaerophilales bacterium]|nr:hypothetical protein [Candidatus Gastranaerophilales bacterium]
MQINSVSSHCSAKSAQSFGMKFKQSPEMEYFLKESIHGHGKEDSRAYIETLRNFLPDIYMLAIQKARLNQYDVFILRKNKKCLWSVETVDRKDNSTSEDVFQMLAGQTDDISRKTIIEELSHKRPETIIDAEIISESNTPLKRPAISKDAIIPEILPYDEALRPPVEEQEDVIVDAEIVD